MALVLSAVRKDIDDADLKYWVVSAAHNGLTVGQRIKEFAYDDRPSIWKTSSGGNIAIAPDVSKLRFPSEQASSAESPGSNSASPIEYQLSAIADPWLLGSVSADAAGALVVKDAAGTTITPFSTRLAPTSVSSVPKWSPLGQAFEIAAPLSTLAPAGIAIADGTERVFIEVLSGSIKWAFPDRDASPNLLFTASANNVGAGSTVYPSVIELDSRNQALSFRFRSIDGTAASIAVQQFWDANGDTRPPTAQTFLGYFAVGDGSAPVASVTAIRAP